MPRHSGVVFKAKLMTVRACSGIAARRAKSVLRRHARASGSRWSPQTGAGYGSAPKERAQSLRVIQQVLNGFIAQPQRNAAGGQCALHFIKASPGQLRGAGDRQWLALAAVRGNGDAKRAVILPRRPHPRLEEGIAVREQTCLKIQAGNSSASY